MCKLSTWELWLSSLGWAWQPYMSSTFSPVFHKWSGPHVQIAKGLGKSSQRKQTTQNYFILAVKLDSVLMCLFVCDKKIELPVVGDKTGFWNPVTYSFIKTNRIMWKPTHNSSVKISTCKLNLYYYTVRWEIFEDEN